MTLSSATAKQADLYVSTDGCDSSQGTEQSPFATLARARDAVRELKGKSEGPVTVLVRDGTYYLEEPLLLGPDDSGSSESPVTYAAYPGESVTLSGGRKLSCEWKPYGNGIMMCAVPEGIPGFAQVFVNGKRQVRARFPNYDPDNPLKYGNGYISAKGGLPDEIVRERMEQKGLLTYPSQGAKGFEFDPDTFSTRKWARPQEAVIHIFSHYGWGILQWEIADIDRDQHIIWFGKGGFQINTQNLTAGGMACGISDRSRYFIENVFEELDAPGEWYLDKDKRILYYLPEDGVDMGSAEVEVPVLEQAVVFSGSQETPVRHVTVSGFRIVHTTSTFLEP